MPDNEMFIVSAKKFEGRCTHDHDFPGVRRRIRTIDPALDILWNGETETAWVAIRLRPGEGPNPDGYPYPLFPVGADPHPDVVYGECLDRSLVGRSRKRSKEFVAEQDAAKKAADKAAVENFLPNSSEYLHRLEQCDDPWSAQMLARDMGKEKRRAA